MIRWIALTGCIVFTGCLAADAVDPTIEAHESALSAVTQLSFYLPLLISAGGNSGAQSSTLMIRGLAVGNVQARDWARVLGREALQGLLLGALLAAVGVTRALVEGASPEFATLIGLTIVIGVTEAIKAKLESDQRVEVTLTDTAAARERLRTGKVGLVVVPTAEPPGWEYVLDPDRPECALARAAADGALVRAAVPSLAVPPVRELDEAGGRYIDFLLPGLLGRRP